MASDVPNDTTHEIRAMVYIRQVNQELDQNKPAYIGQLEKHTGWESKYFTRAWKKLVPKTLVKKTKDGQNTRLQLTDKGRKTADLYMQINEVRNQ